MEPKVLDAVRPGGFSYASEVVDQALRAPSEAAASALGVHAFREESWGEVAAYYERRYGAGYVLARRPFFDWCFASPFQPAGHHGQRLVVDAERLPGERIVGSCGVMVWPLQVGGARVLGQCPVNLFLDEEYRGSGIGQALLESTVVFPTMTYASGARPVTRVLLERFGAAHVTKMRRFVRVFDAETCSDLAASSPAAERGDPGRAAVLADAGAPAAGGAPPSMHLERVQRFGPEWDTAWEAIRTGYGATAWRDAAFLNWRYADYPFDIYEAYLLRREGAVVGFAALRVEQPAFGPVARVVDAVAVPGALGPLLGLVGEVACQRGAVFVDYLVAGAVDEGAVRRAGYRELGGAEGGGYLPLDLNPPRWRDMNVVVHSPYQADLADEVARGDFYFVKGDSDQDRAS